MYKLLLLVTLVITGCTSCKKEVTDANGLPPATQTGAKTFGCLINGKPFIAGDVRSGQSPVLADYQFLYGGYHFRVLGTNGNGTNISGVGIFTDSLKLVQGDSIKLSSYSNSNTTGLAYARYTNKVLTSYTTQLPRFSGWLYITRFDQNKRIVSGTFWFNAITNFSGNNDTISVTNGRFDVNY